MTLLFLLLPLFAQADSHYFSGVPTMKQGYYQDMESSQTALHIDSGLVKLCGFSKFAGGKKGFITRTWTHVGNYLYSGRDRVGEFADHRLYLEQATPDGGKNILLLQWDEAANTFVFSIKHPSIGGFEVKGNIEPASNPELDAACARN